MTYTLFTVVIPAYNYAHTLERAVKSVINQLDQLSELIIINDGSTDNTAEVLNSLEQQYPEKIKTIHQQNSGLAATRNRGIKESSGDYLIFLDADDEFAPEALIHLERAIKSKPDIHMVIGSHISVEPDGRERLRSRAPLPKSRDECFHLYALKEKLPISNGATAMHRNIFEHYLYPENFRCVEDISMFAYVLANHDCMTIQQPVARIHKHDDSMRNDVSLDMSVGLELVDEVFSPDRIPAHLLKYKKEFETSRILSMFRTLYIAGNYQQALSFYWQAVRNSPSALLQGSFLRKAIKAVFLWLANRAQ